MKSKLRYHRKHYILGDPKKKGGEEKSRPPSPHYLPLGLRGCMHYEQRKKNDNESDLDEILLFPFF